MKARHYLNTLAAGMAGTGVALFLFGGNGLNIASGVALSSLSYGLIRKHRIGFTEMIDSSFAVLNESGDAVRDDLCSIFGTPEEIKQTIIASLAQRGLPFAADLKLQERAKQLQDVIWFHRLSRRSKIICGESGDGKTTAMLHDIASFIQRCEAKGRSYRLFICDLDYGSSHDGAPPNTWFDAPKNDVVFMTLDAITRAIDEVHTELEARIERRQNGDNSPNPPWMLSIDEWIAYYQGILHRDGEKVADVIITQIANILNRGLKQGILCTLGLHNLAVSQTGIPQALLQAFNILLLSNASQKFRNYQAIGIPDSDKWKQELLKTRELPGCERSALLIADSEPTIVVVPHINLSGIEIQWTTVDPTEQWFQTALTPELEAELTALAPSTGVTKIAAKFGLSSGDRLNSNPKYLKVKAYWQSLRAKPDSVQKPEPGAAS